DLERPLRELLGVLDFVSLKGTEAHADQDFGRTGIDLQGVRKRLARAGEIVFFQKQHSGLIVGRPEFLVGLERVVENRVENKLELVREAVPTGVFRAGQADDQQL